MPPFSVVVTGLGAFTPIGTTVSAYWSGLLAGVSGASPIQSFDTTHHKTKFACTVKGYDSALYFDRKEANKLDRCTQYGLIASAEAIADSGLLSTTFHADRVGVIWGSGIGGLETAESAIRDNLSTGPSPRFSPYFIPKLLPDITPGHLSIKYGFRGPNFATVAACASSMNALITATQLLWLGCADVIIAGGSEAPIIDCGIGGFTALRALSTRNDAPSNASRPFDKFRDGFVMGEGAGALVVETAAHARARGAKAYAQVAGVGLSADAHHITAPHARGAVAAMQGALRSAGLQPTEVDYINAHATSTPLGDASEVAAIQEVFGAHAHRLNISSTKSMTGHLLGAAGAVESVACVLALRDQVVPPTINHEAADEAFDPRLNFTFHQAQHRRIQVVQNNAFGFGGHNTSIIFKAWEDAGIG